MRHLKPFKTVAQTDSLTYPELKLGVNERDFARGSLACSSARGVKKSRHPGFRNSGFFAFRNSTDPVIAIED